MRPFQRETGLRPMLVGNAIALLFPLVGVLNGHLQAGSLWSYASLALLVVPVLNLLRLLMRATLGVKAYRRQALWATLLGLACLGSAFWWVPRFAGILLH